MKHKVLIRMGLAMAVVLFGSNTAGEREEALFYSKKHFLIQQDECFAKFLSNLNSLEALVYIPEENISQAKKLDMNYLSGDKAEKRNLEFIKQSSSYVQITPSEDKGMECEESIILNFNTLEMAVFVKKENAEKAQDMLQFKVEKEAELNSETMRVDVKSPEILELKKVAMKSFQSFVPVEL